MKLFFKILILCFIFNTGIFSMKLSNNPWDLLADSSEFKDTFEQIKNKAGEIDDQLSGALEKFKNNLDQDKFLKSINEVVAGYAPKVRNNLRPYIIDFTNATKFFKENNLSQSEHKLFDMFQALKINLDNINKDMAQVLDTLILALKFVIVQKKVEEKPDLSSLKQLPYLNGDLVGLSKAGKA